MKYILLSILLLFELGSLSAQSFVGQLNPFPVVSEGVSAAPDTLKILAIMVEFQQDADGTTAGNGKFGSIYTQNYGTDILDPLPHDQQYFETHLEFVKNYYAKVSKGQMTIEYTVLPDTFSVANRMRDYSPPPGSDDFTPLANFSVEAWTLADQIYTGFNFSDYDVFLIFHAGVGRDVSLPGSLGNERDLPSIYLSYLAFKEIYGEEFDGIPVSNGSFNITNSVIIPETESREVESLTGTVLFQLTINGLLCSSIGSHLGLPDLFDTETGLSAIGRFGLMDGQSIFAYAGTYPPEPSPWEKLYLSDKYGWGMQYAELDIQNADVNLVTDVVATLADTVILKVPLSSSEYYLVENRQRDANNDGSILTYFNNGVIQTKTFPTDTTGYYSFNVDSLSGVITDVDEFDWAVPGDGILIWHIDENVINQKIADNAVNTDKHQRGVDIEEADGVQDIGERFYTIFGDEVIGEGEQVDFWYKSNPAELFQDLFDKNTRPSTRTNTGANSLITMKNFSEIANKMSFSIEFGDSVIKPIFNVDVPIVYPVNGFTVNQFNGQTDFLTLFSSDLITVDSSGIKNILPNFSFQKPGIITLENINQIYGTHISEVIFKISNGNDEFLDSVQVEEIIITSPVINLNDQNEYEIIFGCTNGKVYKYLLGSLPNSFPILNETIELDTHYVITKIAAHGDFVSLIAQISDSFTPEHLYWSVEGQTIFLDEIPIALSVTRNAEGNNIAIIYTDKKKFYGIIGSEIISEFSVNSKFALRSFALADLKQEGTNYIVINNGLKIEAYNLTGVLADNFPFTDPLGVGFTGTPVCADFEGDGNSEIISVTKDGRIFAIDGGTGKVVSGFPISCGSDITVTPVLYNANGVTNLAVLNDQNILSAWSISSVEGTLYWSEEYGNPQNTSFIEAASNTNRINEFFPTDKAYNYPNPVYESTTYIRYYVSENASINIKIFDLAGDFVAELNDDAQGGVDNETVWDVSNIQSGIYFARIEATSNNQTEQAVVKIAVVK